MPDNQLDILIKFGLSKEKATEAVAEIKKIETATKEGGKTAVKAEEQVEEATKKTFTSKKQLKDMLKQVGHEFPILGSLGRLALNPIAFTTASIVSAFQIWKYRTDELTKSLGGIEMANVNETQVALIERMGAAMAKAAASTGQTEFGRMKKDLEDLVALVEAKQELLAAMGIDTGTKPLESKAIAKGTMAARLEADARARLKAAGTPMSEDKEKAIGAQLSAAAQKAETDRKEAMDRLNFIQEYKAAPTGKRNIMAFKYAARYGNLPPDDAAGLEQGNINSQQGIIDRFGRFTAGSADRAARRASIATAQSELGTAASLDSEVVQLLRQIAAGTAGRLLPNSPNPDGGLTDPKLVAAQKRFFQTQPELMAAVERAIIAAERVSARVSNLERR